MWEEGYRFVEVNYQFTKGNHISFTKWKRMAVEDLGKWLDENPGKEAYFCTIQRFSNPVRTKDEAHIAPFFVDLDADDPADALRDARLIVDYFLQGHDTEPQVWYSGNRGFHITVPGLVFGAKPDTKLTYHWRHVLDKIVRKLAIKTADEAVYSLPRMWRIENTRHPKSGNYKIPLNLAELQFELEAIRSLAASPRQLDRAADEYELETKDSLVVLYQKAKADYQDKKKLVEYLPDQEYTFDDSADLPACVKFLMDNGLAELGTKNRADMALAGFFKSAGYPIETATQLMADWAMSIPESLTHIHRPEARAAQSQAVCKIVYSDPKYGFSCGSILSCGMEVDCESCSVKEVEAKEITLSEYSKVENMKVKVSLEADVIGRDSKDYIIPRKVRGWCNFNPDSKVCLGCSMQNYFNAKEMRNERTMVFDAKNDLILELLDTSAVNLKHRIKRIFGVASRCPSFRHEVEWGNATTIFISSRLTNFRVEDNVSRVKAMYLGHGIHLNQSYRLVGYTHSHPRTQAATFIISDAEPISSSLETFVLDDEAKSALKVFQAARDENPLEKMMKIEASFINTFLFIFGREDLILAADLVFHSARRISFQKQSLKGWLDVLIIGDTRQGKTDTVEKLMQYYDLGTMASGESSSRTGLLYNIQTTQGEDAWVQFGLLCRANGLLVAIDEIHGMPRDDFKAFTLVRSKGLVDVKRYAFGSALAETRLISIANPRESMTMDSYGYPVMAIDDLPCFKSKEDISRFDFAVGVKAGDVEDRVINTDVNIIYQESTLYTPELCKDLVLWVWTRKPDDIIISGETEAYVLQAAQDLGAEYVPDIPLVESADLRSKIVRIATAIAGRLYNTPDGERLIVESKHVSSALDVLNRFYKSDSLNYWGYSDDAAKLYISEEDMIVLAADFKLQYPMLWSPISEWMLRTNEFTKTLIKASLGITGETADSLIMFSLNNSLIRTSWRALRKTPQGRKFFYGLLHGFDKDIKEEDDL